MSRAVTCRKRELSLPQLQVAPAEEWARRNGHLVCGGWTGTRFLSGSARSLLELQTPLAEDMGILEADPPFPFSSVELLPGLSERSLTAISQFGGYY